MYPIVCSSVNVQQIHRSSKKPSPRHCRQIAQKGGRWKNKQDFLASEITSFVPLTDQGDPNGKSNKSHQRLYARYQTGQAR